MRLTAAPATPDFRCTHRPYTRCIRSSFVFRQICCIFYSLPGAAAPASKDIDEAQGLGNLLSVKSPSFLLLSFRDRKAARLVTDGEMFTLSVRRQEYLMKVIFYRLSCSAVGGTLIRQRSVLGFSANIGWLVSHFYIIALLQSASVLNIND